MEGVGLGLRETEISQRVPAVKETKVVIMVDPVEAKRLAALEMMAIQARAKLKVPSCYTFLTAFACLPTDTLEIWTIMLMSRH